MIVALDSTICLGGGGPDRLLVRGRTLGIRYATGLSWICLRQLEYSSSASLCNLRKWAFAGIPNLPAVLSAMCINEGTVSERLGCMEY
jgi:hypothetical protein